ncbi:unnamed protein product [Auanema sp. JU1783]|nr:unnamed protein product [Auanema sp. JU1783]
MIGRVLLRPLEACKQVIRSGSSVSSRSQDALPWTPSGDPHTSFYSNDLLITSVNESEKKTKPVDGDNLGFGLVFSDYMVDIDWSAKNGWTRPHLKKMENLSLHPAAKSLHYASQLFEGMKAYRGVDGRVRLFRPDLNMDRMKRSANRCALPDFDANQLIDIIVELVRHDIDWVPYSEVGSLYIRPTMIGTDSTLGVAQSGEAKLFVLSGPVGGYFGKGNQAVTLLADPESVRAWPGGVGAYKMGCNYAPTVRVSANALKKGCHQVLWLSEEKQWVTEVGTMNVFMFWRNENGEDELVTPSLKSGTILPGVTRQSLLDLSRQWGEFKVVEKDFTIHQLRRAVKENRLYEFFGCGTAAVVTPVEGILYINREEQREEKISIPTLSSPYGIMKRLYQEVIDIQYGRSEQPGWTREIS